MHADTWLVPADCILPCLACAQIRQVSAQVHDIRGRVKHLVKLMEGKGYTVEVHQEPRFAACNLHMVYACRQSQR